MSGMRISLLGGLAAATLWLAAQAGLADPTWQQNGIALNPSTSIADVIGTTDALMASPIGKQATGRLLLLFHVADGDDPATISYVSINKTTAEAEAFGQKLNADPAWDQFVRRMANLGSVSSTVRYRTLRSWGDISDTDVVWLGVGLAVKDVSAVIAARDRFGATATGKKFPGQTHFSAVVAAGASPVTHVFSVGYASEAEMEAWTQTRDTADWEAYQKELQAGADILGFNLARVLKAWGPATMKDVSAK